MAVYRYEDKLGESQDRSLQPVTVFRVDAEFRSLIPPLLSEERAQLEANIAADGCRDPLVLWRGLILDGHNRYEICQANGKGFRTVEVDLPDREAAKGWIICNQLGRRNLTPEQASYLRGKRYNQEKRPDGGHGDQRSGGHTGTPIRAERPPPGHAGLLVAA